MMMGDDGHISGGGDGAGPLCWKAPRIHGKLRPKNSHRAQRMRETSDRQQLMNQTEPAILLSGRSSGRCWSKVQKGVGPATLPATSLKQRL